MNTKRLTKMIAFMIAMILILSTVATALAAYSTIPYGSTGDNVRKMQTALRQKGFYKGRVDGKFGPATKQAVIAFQKSVSLSADGKPGNKTLTALYHGKSAINKADDGERNYTTNPTNPHTLYYGCTGRRVERLQYALKKAGVYKGNIDGVYGDLTYDAVRAYQRKKGLAADGMAGTKTLNSLYKNTNVNVGTSFQLAEGSKGREVEELMHYLREKGYTNENTDLFTAQFAEDVKAWQAATGKEVTGMITEAQYNNIVLGKEK